MKSASKCVYLDNNATTEQCKPALEAAAAWASIPANASTTSEAGRAARKMIEDGRKLLLAHCGLRTGYTCVFTSGASESNSFILRSTVDAWWRHKKERPHILTSLTEHKSIRDTCAALERAGRAQVSYIAPGISGCVPPKLVSVGLRPNTCIVSIMSANNELGCINDLEAIAAIAHEHNVPLHSDCVQTFGKYKPPHGLDAISASFHKLYGPKGCGLLIINDDLVSGYGLEAQIAGSQEFGLRGGTENIPAIAGAIAAFRHTWTKRAEKNARMCRLRTYLISILAHQMPVQDYKLYATREDAACPQGEPSLVFLGPADCQGAKLTPGRALPNTLLIAIAKPIGEPFCNGKLKRALDKAGFVVSVGSACNTTSAKASHVLDAIRAPGIIKRGVIRVSLCDTTTKTQIDAFAEAFMAAIAAQMKGGRLP